MFCGHCGFKVENNVTVCPNCGGRLNPANAAAPQNNPNGADVKTPVNTSQQNNAYGSSHTNRPGETGQSGGGKKKAKFPVKAVIACLLAAALIVSGIIFLPKFLPAGGSKANAFEAQAKEIGKKDENYPLLHAVAAAENLLFNAESFTFNADVWEEDASASGRVVWGKDITSPQIVFSGRTDYGEKAEGAMTDGKAVVVMGEDDYWEYGISADVARIYEGREQIKKAIDGRYSPDDYDEDANRFVSDFQNKIDKDDKFEKNWFSVISSKGINRDALNYLIPQLISYYGLLYDFSNNQGGNLPEINADGLNYDDVSSLAAEFLAGLPYGTFEAVKDDNSADSFSYRINCNKFAEALYNYVKGSDVIRAAVPGYFYEEFLEELEYELGYYDYDIHGRVEIENGYLSSLDVKVDSEEVFSVTVSDINKTQIKKNEYDNVSSKYSRCDEKREINDTYDENNYSLLIACPREFFLYTFVSRYSTYSRKASDAVVTNAAEDILTALKTDIIDPDGQLVTANYSTATLIVKAGDPATPITLTPVGFTLKNGDSDIAGYISNIAGLSTTPVKSTAVWQISVTNTDYNYTFSLVQIAS